MTTDPHGSVALRLLIQDVRAEAARETAKVESKMETHEAVCAERYKQIMNTLERVGRQLGSIASTQGEDREQASATAWGLNWKAWGAVGAGFILLISALAWESSQLYSLEPVRAAAQSHAH